MAEWTLSMNLQTMKEYVDSPVTVLQGQIFAGSLQDDFGASVGTFYFRLAVAY